MIEITITEYDTVVAALPDATARALQAHPVAGLSVSPAAAEGTWTLRASSMVGVVQIGDVVVTVLPKIPIDTVVGLLMSTPPLERVVDSDAPVGQTPDLLRLIVHAFAHSLERALARGLRREYQVEHELLAGVRGRIDIATLARRPFATGRIPCVFDDYTADTGLNRLLLAAVQRCARIPLVRGPDRTLLRRCESALDGVGTDPDSLAWYDTWTPSRLDRHFEDPARLAALLLRNLTIDERVGNIAARSFFVDMNRLVESFIEEELRAALRGRCEVVGQANRRLDTAGRVAMRPDLCFRHDGRDVLVADVKYKVVSSTVDAATADLYQANAYASAMGLPDAVLITCGPDIEGPRDLVVRHSGTHLHVRPVRLSGGRDDLARAIGDLGDSLVELIKGPSPARGKNGADHETNNTPRPAPPMVTAVGRSGLSNPLSQVADGLA